METPPQEKRRGRRRKSEVKMAVENGEAQESPPSSSPKPRTEKGRERRRIAERIEEKMESLERVFREPSFMQGVYTRFYKRRYEESERYLQEISKSRDERQWSAVMQTQTMKKVCSVLGFLLKSGPMTKVEDEIFNECVEILQEYYIERAELIKRNDKMKEMHIRTTYYPSKETAVYRFMVEMLEIPQKEKLFDY